MKQLGLIFLLFSFMTLFALETVDYETSVGTFKLIKGNFDGDLQNAKVAPKLRKNPSRSSADLSNLMPPPGNQGGQGSCTAWATGYAYKTFQEGLEHQWDLTVPEHQFSAAFVYNQINGGGDNGSHVGNALNLMCNKGITTLADQPYSDSDYLTWPTPDNFVNAMPYRAQDYYYFPMSSYYGYTDSDQETLKAHLDSGDCFVYSFTVYSDFDSQCSPPYYTYTVPGPSAEYDGGHAICVVGYDDNHDNGNGTSGAYRILNSWGPGWGDGGYFWMSYEFVRDYGDNHKAFYMTDRQGYQPTGMARIFVDIDHRGDLDVDLLLNDSYLMNVYDHAGGEASDMYVVADITDHMGHFPPSETNEWKVRIVNTGGDNEGYIDEFTISDFTDMYSHLNNIVIFGGGTYAATVNHENYRTKNPEFSLPSGNYPIAQTLELTCPTPEAVIHYTLDGRNPGLLSPIYQGPLTIDEPTIVKMLAIKDGYVESETVTAHYSFMTWQAALGENVKSSPAFQNETMYVGTQSNQLYAINTNTGETVWSYDCGNRIISSPVVGPNGKIYVGTFGNELYAINADGSLAWVHTASNKILSTPAVTVNGDVVFGCFDGNITAVYSDGTEKWSYNTGSTFLNAPAVVDQAGNVYIGNDAGVFYCIKHNGQLAWQYDTGSRIRSSSVIDVDGNLYFTTLAGTLYALTTNGDERWQYEADGQILASPVLTENNEIIICDRNANVVAVAGNDGSEVWTRNTGSEITQTPTIGSDGIIYIADNGNHINAVNSDGSFRWQEMFNASLSGSPVLYENHLLFTDLGGSLFSVLIKSEELMDSWARFQGNNTNNAQVQTVLDAVPVVYEAKALINLSNYPNPFNPETCIQFSLSQSAQVDLTVYNIKGQRVKNLIMENKDAGNHSVMWNGINQDGASVASGLYLYRLKINGEIESVKKMMLMK